MASNTHLQGETQGNKGADLAAKITLYEAAFKKATAVCSEAARGNLEARITEIDSFGEVGGMLWAINRMLDLTDAFVREAGTSLTYASEGKFFRRFVLRGMLGDFRRGAMTINTAREDMEKKTRQTAAAEAEAEKQRKQREQDQAAAAKQRQELAESFGSKVGTVVHAVSAAAAEMEATASEMAKMAGNAHRRSQAVAEVADSATQNVQAVASATEELSASISEISIQVTESTKATRGVVDGMNGVNEAVKVLSEAAEEIDKVVEFIRRIAGQTNLLALNATIEAARAGEAGKGFALVAAEVKNLAQQTANATQDIGEKIRGIQDASRQTADATTRISTSVGSVSEIATAIASAVEEQSAATTEISGNVHRAAEGTKEVSGNVAEISDASQQTGVAAEDVLSSAGKLTQQAKALSDEVDRFLESFRAA